MLQTLGSTHLRVDPDGFCHFESNLRVFARKHHCVAEPRLSVNPDAVCRLDEGKKQTQNKHNRGTEK